MRLLQVFLDEAEVGELQEHEGLWRFSYADSWRASSSAFDLSPAIPRAAGTVIDGSSVRPVQWFFDNLLPEEGARLLLARDAGVEQADAFGLLACYGAESAGALTLLPPDGQLETGGLQALTDHNLSERIRALPRISLTGNAPKRMSLAGAQHKLAVSIREGLLFEPVGTYPSTYILKPDHPDTEGYPHSVVNEWFAMSVARHAGLTVPEVQIRRVPEPVYLVQRFDRTFGEEPAKRLYVLDACQLLGIGAIWKYQKATLETLAQILDLCRFKAATRIALFRWLVFNLLIGNNDAHLKNLSFFVKPDGVELAPHYDLLCTAVYSPANDWLGSDLVWKLGAMRCHADVTRASVLEMAAALGVPTSLATRELDKLCATVPAGAAHWYTTYMQQLSAGEARLVRQIIHGVMKDMLARLSRG